MDEHRYSSIKGTLLFNSIGVPFSIQSGFQVNVKSESLISEASELSLVDSKENSLLQSNNTPLASYDHQAHDEKLPAVVSIKDTDEDESSWVEESISTSSPVIFDSPIVESINSNPSSDDNSIEESQTSARPSSAISINELLERSRSPFEKSKLVGHALYHVSAHMQHSCDPNITLLFPYKNNTLQVVASRRIEKGDEICMSYIPLSTGMTSGARRAALKATYHIDCICILCEADLPLA